MCSFACPHFIENTIFQYKDPVGSADMLWLDGKALSCDSFFWGRGVPMAVDLWVAVKVMAPWLPLLPASWWPLKTRQDWIYFISAALSIENVTQKADPVTPSLLIHIAVSFQLLIPFDKSSWMQNATFIQSSLVIDMDLQVQILWRWLPFINITKRLNMTGYSIYFFQ